MKKPRRLLVGLKTMDHAVTLADLACRTAAKNATVFLVHVIELPDTTPLDAEVPDLERTGRKILQTAERVVRRSGLKAETMMFRARLAGEALLDEISSRKIELGIFGYHHRRSLTELLLGTVAQHLTRHAPCHILLEIPPRD
jgi:nucleotide-binding universal stress UspA family protein